MTSAPSAQDKRDQAARARRLANTFPLDGDRLPLLRHAEELEREAEALERQAASAARPELVEQRQVQQQQQQGEAAAGDKPPMRPKTG